MTTLRDISNRRGVLDKARREAMRDLMKEYDKGHYAAMKALREECEQGPGHDFKFSHLGPLGHPWFYCTGCGASKVEGLDE